MTHTHSLALTRALTPAHSHSHAAKVLAHCSLRRQKRFILDFSGSARHSRHAAVAVAVVAVASAFAFGFAAVCTFQVLFYCYAELQRT